MAVSNGTIVVALTFFCVLRSCRNAGILTISKRARVYLGVTIQLALQGKLNWMNYPNSQAGFILSLAILGKI